MHVPSRGVRTAGRTLSAIALALAFGGPAWAFDLTQALDAARAYDAQYRGAVFELEGSREYRIQGRAGLLPELTGSGTAYRNHLDTKLGEQEVVQRYDSSTAVLQFRQPLFNRDVAATWRRGEAQTRLGELVFAAKSDDLVLRLVEGYSKVLLSQEQLRLSEAQVEALGEESKSNERLFARGEGTRTDLLESKSSLELARAQVIESRNAYDDAVAALRAVVGPQFSLDDLKRLESNKFEFTDLTPALLDDWRKLAEDYNSEMAARKVSVEIARQDLARADAGHYPRVDLIGVLSRSKSDSVNTVNQTNTQASVGVQVQVPIYSGGRVNSLQRQSIAAVAKAETDYDNSAADVNLKLQTEYQGLFSGARRILALQVALQAGTEQVEATRKSVIGGVRTRLEVLRAQQQVTQTARDLAKARFDHALSWLRLRSLGGQLHEENLAEVQQKLESGLLPTPPQSGVPASGS